MSRYWGRPPTADRGLPTNDQRSTTALRACRLGVGAPAGAGVAGAARDEPWASRSPRPTCVPHLLRSRCHVHPPLVDTSPVGGPPGAVLPRTRRWRFPPTLASPKAGAAGAAGPGVRCPSCRPRPPDALNLRPRHLLTPLHDPIIP